uniref:Uncharacterized protein n=1 Tax=Oryzias latipes TaxID=8090 RepID=A0A3P9MMS6_ORYLA
MKYFIIFVRHNASTILLALTPLTTCSTTPHSRQSEFYFDRSERKCGSPLSRLCSCQRLWRILRLRLSSERPHRSVWWRTVSRVYQFLGTGCMIKLQSSMSKHIPELKKYGVTTVVRVCEATYDAALVVKEGIQVLDWPFDDGAPPSNQIVDDWLNLLKLKFREEPGCCIAVHCVAGLGRAPVLVALALIECGMKYEDAVQFIRQKRRGAFNSKQLFYLEKYRPKMRLRFKDSNGHRNNCCIQ